jgi:hypothetical protein
MRNWIKLFEDDFESEDDDSDAVSQRQHFVQDMIIKKCLEQHINLHDEPFVVYDEADQTVMIRVYGAVTYRQLSKLMDFSDQDIEIHPDTIDKRRLYLEFKLKSKYNPSNPDRF